MDNDYNWARRFLSSVCAEGEWAVLKAVFFDLDNTLYDSASYFSSAFNQIARFLASHFGLSEGLIVEKLWCIFREKGSLYGKLFNDVLAFYALDDSNLVRELVRLFHEAPTDSLELYEDVQKVLPQLAGKYKVGLITNGHPGMQRRKVAALGLQDLLPIRVYTTRIGCPKPNLQGYDHAVRAARVEAEESVYVGDNPYVDFTGAKHIGMRTVRHLRGEFKQVRANRELIDAEVGNFYELEKLLSYFAPLAGQRDEL